MVLWQDCLIVLAFILYFGTGVATRLIISQVAQETGYGMVATELESNPIMRAAMSFRYGMIISMAMAVSMLGGVYYMIRRKYIRAETLLERETQYLILSFYVIAIFLMFLQNILNDLPILIGINM